MPKVKTTAQKAKHAPSSSCRHEIKEDDTILDDFEEEEEEMMENRDQLGSSVGRKKKGTSEEINQALYINLADARDPHRPGKFKEEYKLINHVVHFNLNPGGAENHPSLKDAKLLYAFMLLGTVIDWLASIFKQLIEFKANVSLSIRMSYPCLITKICRRYRVTGQKYLDKAKLEPAVINNSILTKSVSQSRVPRGVSIIESMRKSKKESREMAQRQARMEHRLEWLSRRAEGSTQEPYAPPLIVQEEDSDDFAGNEPD
ncbi:hypothetical protein RHSIM_Rhsim01G0146700 [Rhododendron simsii]|uniref:Uncharacterized protein n=1 Tax=Rhododendron simsii TaxID=118357 RepID=A0A834HDI5_RHOSS|nr:hypothetical protein RHSIM_Rhsim01G0146700 [Rhododendron simsii]